MNKKIFIINAIVATALGTVACRNNFDEVSPANSISFNVSTIEETEETRAEMEIVEERQQTVMFSEDGHLLVATCEVSGMNGYTEEADTRATRYKNESAFSGQTFGIYSWDITNSNTVVYNNESVSKVGGKWVPATTKQWGPYQTLVFEAVYPKPTTPLGSTGLTSLTTSPTPGNLSFSYARPANAGGTDDLMFAYYSGNCTGNAAKLVFTHALTCVRFQAASGLTINSITMGGVLQSGSCTVTTASNANGTYYNYVWNTSGSTTGSISCNTGVDYLLIPQSLSSAPVSLTVNVSDAAGISYTTSATLNTNNWVAGCVNTYTFSLDGESVQIGVNDNVNTTTNEKNNLIIKNNGTSKAYIRAAIEAAWVDDDGFIVAGYTFNASNFENLCGSNWVKYGDYYYYTNPVNAGAETPSKLFTKFTAPSSPVPGAHLEMQIFAQGVIWDRDKARVNNAWGSATVTGAGLN